jgi:hypothetical protein
MMTTGFYGSSAESAGLYGTAGPNYGGTYFNWYVFQVAASQPATPTGGSWDFDTNTGTPPTGWTADPPTNPTNIVWVSISLVDSRQSTALTWSTPGQFAYSSGAGLAILSGTVSPSSGVGTDNQLYIQTGVTPQAIWFKESGTWVQQTGGSVYISIASGISGGSF